MPITTYTAGEVLTAASLNANFSAVNGLTLVKTQVIGSAVASVAVTGAFSSSYDNYKITITGGVGSNSTEMSMQLGSTTTGYSRSLIYATYAGGAPTNIGNANIAQWNFIGSLDTDSIKCSLEILGPNLAKKTYIYNGFADAAIGGNANGYLNNTTQYTGFTIFPTTGTLTGGTIRVYGYANS
jgi:hypothetical protein